MLGSLGAHPRREASAHCPCFRTIAKALRKDAPTPPPRLRPAFGNGRVRRFSSFPKVRGPAPWRAHATRSAVVRRDAPMPHGKRIGLEDRARVFELAGQGLSAQGIAERLRINPQTVRDLLAKGLRRCARCGRLIDGGNLCPVCSLPEQAPLGPRLKAFRVAAGVSQWGLALKINVAISQVRRWESGQKQPAEHELQLLADTLGITVQELTG